MRMGRLSAAGILLATGCFTLRPQADPSRFYHLRVTTTVAATGGTTSVGIGPIRMPAYLDRSHIMQRISDVEVAPREHDYWADPLGEQIQQILAEEVRLRAGLARVQLYPWRTVEKPDRRVDIDIRQFASDSAGAVELRARWEIRTTVEPPRIVASGEDSWQEQAQGSDMADQVDAMSRALGALAGAISARLR